MENTEQHLFAENEYRLVHASVGKRLANYIIDVLVFYVLAFAAINVIAMANPSILDSISEEKEGYNLGQNLLLIFVFILYISGFEAIFKGKTVGKFITGTRAVNEDGSNLTIKTAFLRGLCRAIPFEQFSAVGNPSYPLHDRWAKSYVIDEKESNRPSV